MQNELQKFKLCRSSSNSNAEIQRKLVGLPDAQRLEVQMLPGV